MELRKNFLHLKRKWDLVALTINTIIMPVTLSFLFLHVMIISRPHTTTYTSKVNLLQLLVWDKSKMAHNNQLIAIEHLHIKLHLRICRLRPFGWHNNKTNERKQSLIKCMNSAIKTTSWLHLLKIQPQIRKVRKRSDREIKRLRSLWALDLSQYRLYSHRSSLTRWRYHYHNNNTNSNNRHNKILTL